MPPIAAQPLVRKSKDVGQAGSGDLIPKRVQLVVVGDVEVVPAVVAAFEATGGHQATGVERQMGVAHRVAERQLLIFRRTGRDGDVAGRDRLEAASRHFEVVQPIEQ